MNKIESITKNPFFSIRISRNRLRKFVIDHIDRTKAADNPAFVQIINETMALDTLLINNLYKLDKDNNSKQSLTVQVNKGIREFKAKVLELGNLVCYTFQKKSGAYQEFFPYGRTEYYRTSRKNIINRFERIISACTKYETELGSDWKTLFTQLRDAFIPVFDDQQSAKGAVLQTASDFAVKKKAVCHQLYKNLLTILLAYHEHPEKARAFFDETIINFRKHHKKEKESAERE